MPIWPHRLRAFFGFRRDGEGRFWPIDAARGIAVVMMVVSNFVFDLFFFTPLPIGIGGFWGLFARLTAGSFLFLAGLSLTLPRAGARDNNGFSRYAVRGGRLFALGMLVSLATWFVAGQQYVRFGILHLLGLVTVLAYPVIGRRWLALCLAAVIFIAWRLIDGVMVRHAWLLWVGIEYPGYRSVDYTPLLPWAGAVFFGVFAGGCFYREGRFGAPATGPGQFVRPLAWLGRNSLWIYLLHQPILIGLIQGGMALSKQG